MLKRILTRSAGIGIGMAAGRWLNIFITNPLTAVPTWQLVGIAAIGGFCGSLVIFGIVELIHRGK